jgi:hypothetical protein
MTDAEDEVADLVEEHRDLFERLANSELPIAEDCERALELIMEGKD